MPLFNNKHAQQETILFGNPEFESDAARAAARAAGGVPPGVGAGCVIRRAVVDEGARVGAGARLVNARRLRDGDGAAAGLPAGVAVRDGVIVVKRGALIPDGTVV